MALPTLVGAGAVIGAFLRSLSRQAQEQVTLTESPLSCLLRGHGLAVPTGPSLPAGGQGHRGGGRGAGQRADRACFRHGGAAGGVREGWGPWGWQGCGSGTPAHPWPRLFCAEVDRAGHLSEKLGLGIAAFQGLSNLALNGEWRPQSGTWGAVGWEFLGQDLLQMPLLHVPLKSRLCPHPAGIVLGTIFVGGSLMAGDELSPGDLMSFLVASQTVQRSGQGPVVPPVPLAPPIAHSLPGHSPELNLCPCASQVLGQHLHPDGPGRWGEAGDSGLGLWVVQAMWVGSGGP